MQSLAANDDLTIEATRFRSGRFRLEGELVYAAGPALGAAVIAGPHPLLGGTMRNNVVRGLAEGLARRGVATLRFNYRGVGNSEGPPVDVAAQMVQFWETSHVPCEPTYREDLTAAVGWLREALGDSVSSALIGYSFGCSLLPHVVPGIGVPLVLVGPTIGTHDYSEFATLSNPLLVIASEDDFAASNGRANQWFDELAEPKQLIQGRFDNHFFRGHEEWLAGAVFDFLRMHWENHQ